MLPEASSRLLPYLAVLAHASVLPVDSRDMTMLCRSLCKSWAPVGQHGGRMASLSCSQICSWRSWEEAKCRSRRGQTLSRREHFRPSSAHSTRGRGLLLAHTTHLDTMFACTPASLRIYLCWRDHSQGQLRRHPRTRAAPETLADGSFSASLRPDHLIASRIPSSVLDLSH